MTSLNKPHVHLMLVLGFFFCCCCYLQSHNVNVSGYIFMEIFIFIKGMIFYSGGF